MEYSRVVGQPRQFFIYCPVIKSLKTDRRRFVVKNVMLNETALVKVASACMIIRATFMN